MPRCQRNSLHKVCATDARRARKSVSVVKLHLDGPWTSSVHSQQTVSVWRRAVSVVERARCDWTVACVAVVKDVSVTSYRSLDL